MVHAGSASFSQPAMIRLRPASFFVKSTRQGIDTRLVAVLFWGAAAEPVWPAQASSQGRLPVPEQAPPWLVSADTSNHPQTMQRRMPTIRVQVFSYYLLLLCVLKSTHSRHFPTIENGRVYDLPTEQTPAPLKATCFLCRHEFSLPSVQAAP